MIPYIINVALILAGCLAFYKILLHKETFYKMNRYVLMLCLFIAFSLPLVRVPQQLSFRKTEAPAIMPDPSTWAVEQPAKKTTAVPPQEQTISAEKKSAGSSSSGFSVAQLKTWMLWLYWFGVAAFGFNFLLQMITLLWRAYRNPVIIDGRYRIVEVKGDKAPCSFGSTIFINPEKYDWETYNQIILHEKIHIRENHTLDIIIAELVLIFQWFNPFAWIYRREIESNLEYLTDDQLVQKNDVEKTSYQMSLLKVSAPHFPLSLTTNYNQSILKKRIAMMNAKKSNIHTAWKYFFLLPVLALLACLLNEPTVHAQKKEKIADHEKNINHGIQNEGYWFATIKGEKVNIRFSDEEQKDEESFSNGNSFSGTTFKLSDLSNIPTGTSGTFTITREAGKMEFTGKFENNMGMGRYKFIADKAYETYMNGQLKDKLEEHDQLVFFFINVTKDYVKMLKAEGFANIEKDQVIPLAAMNIDGAYIKSIKDAGFKEIELEDLIPLKALGVDNKYIKEIRDAGYKNVTTDQLVNFKSQGIDKEYINKVREMKNGNEGDADDDADDIVTFKAMNIDEEFINSFKALGYKNIPHDQLVSMKALGVDAAYVKSWQDLGYKQINPEHLVGMKSQNVTPEFYRSLQEIGYKSIEPENMISLKALGVTPEYIKSFQSVGYNSIELGELPGLKSMNVTPDFIKSFEPLGFKDIDVDEIISVKAVGVTPEWIKSMREKGFNYNSIGKYVTLKSIQ